MATRRLNRAGTLASLTIAVAAALITGPAHAADPSMADCLTASESSLALRNQHKLRDARAQLLVCAAASCPAEIRDECVRRVAEVNAAMPTIVFEVTDAAGNDLVAVAVAMDGAPLLTRIEATALAIDPGQHAFTFTAAGRATVQKDVLVREGDKDRRVVVELGEVAVAPRDAEKDAAGGSTVVETLAPPPAKTEAPRSALGTQKIVALAVAGVGLVGLGVGTWYGLEAFSRHDDAENACAKNPCNDVDRTNLRNYARSAGNASTAAFIVGAVGVAGAAALWLTATPEAPKAGVTQVGLGPGTLQLGGVW